MDIFEACRDGNLDWLKQQHAAKKLGRVMVKNQLSSKSLFPHEYAAAGGHLEVLKWLVLESGKKVDLTRNHNQALRFAVKHEHLEVIKWLVSESGQPVNVADFGNDAINCAAWTGNLEIVKWLVQESRQVVNLATDGGMAALVAAENGHFEVLKWLVESSGQPVDPADGLYAAAMNGSFEICRWIFERIDIADLDEMSLIWSVFMELIGHGDLDLVKWMVQNLPAKLSGNMNHAFELAAFAGHVHIAQWLVYDSGQLIDITANNHQALKDASEKNHRDVVEWLSEEYRRCADQIAINSAAKHGNLQLLKWLVEARGDGVDARKIDLGPETGISIRLYVDSVRLLQKDLGIKKWRELIRKKHVGLSNTRLRRM